MNRLKTLVVDDESLARKGLAIRLKEFEQLELMPECKTSREAVEIIVKEKPDLIFLDIQMPGLNGFEVLKAVKEQGQDLPIVVFVTAYDEYAIKAFEVRALDYLLKPVDDARLAECVKRVISEHQNVNDEQQSKLISLVAEVTGQDADTLLERLSAGENITADEYPDYIAIKDSGEITRVAVKDIKWVDAAGDYMCIHAGDETHILRRTMKELEQDLNPKLFQRVHRSAIVNIKQVEKLCNQQNGEYHLQLKNGQKLKVSRSYKDRIKQLILS
ncbi:MULTISPECIES: LytTR family DNA-binding domain-containing protein [Idiomarina]|jgi:two-component system LytT family response regulator|uniref:LytR/AlgR family response regulator transcription factor n=1 Tax=Idiomarina TaxID=135575 RepID=UPI0006C8844C|nr:MULTISPECIES: LytTR family DNA-binding domain-containing protein [Idiomarina]KPD22658.1 chemotaxis protein CheY [Idiomarina abyssalis]MAO66826.1 DNA-binding response regulator [Idiomarina sp.]MBF79975.1 DNA-binding response regulator [Idiomarina sp.]MBH95332.1 DNA-binding response regulator [Idiomarina sp.]MBP59380.1 DNA-binding response regulator [Idiomarina sp.]|tara:strand:+ start:198 stop:1016 length:819 start_codon:yes stop_codon:yes gene_type:complete